jgi:hypothetical protein
MEFSRTQVAFAIGVGALLVAIFFGYLLWLNSQGPVLARSEERDPLSGIPESISLNPLRDRSSEREAGKFIGAMRDGRCSEQLAKWQKDYRKKYAAYICDSEKEHPLLAWRLVEWEDSPPLRILHYRGKRLDNQAPKNTYEELFSVTLDKRSGQWAVTKYDAMY